MTPAVAAIIPTLNEEGAIGATVRGLPREHLGLIVVVDGESRDNTADEARAAGAVVIVEPRAGYGRACATGAAFAAESGAEILVFLDGDGADAPEALPLLTAPLCQGSHDFVLGSRTRGRREKGSMNWHQLAAGRAIGAAVGLVSGVRYSDMCAFRAIHADTLARLGLREMGYGWNLEMQMRAAVAGLRILEVPVPYRRRLAGSSKVSGNLRGTLRAGFRIMRVLERVAAETRRESARRQRPGG